MYELTTHQLQVERRESHRANQVCAHHTPATGGEEREYRANQVLRSPPLVQWRGERVIEPNQVCAPPHTATGGEERES